MFGVPINKEAMAEYYEKSAAREKELAQRRADHEANRRQTVVNILESRHARLWQLFKKDDDDKTAAELGKVANDIIEALDGVR